ncbi:MAG TPA: isoprenylcysteine carboxylmethyltransferase family protein [Planctomycetaceae bacterium]|nr:isoprenylcysteine carboxylmethyltransferase family protein [Planctomycetaceae bacterium]
MNEQCSLPFGGGPLYLSVFSATFALWLGAELALNAMRRSTSLAWRHDRSFRLLFLGHGMGFCLDFASALFLPSAAIAAARTVFCIGIGCVLAGTALRWYAVTKLGRYFTVDVVTQVSQPVIDFGPYRYIRHPAYAGSLLALIGFARALGNWAGLLAMLLLPGSAFGYRIAVEEAALLSTLGEPYARYMRRTWRLIPYLI